MLKFMVACTLMLALAGSGFGQEEARKLKNPEPIVPEGEKMVVGEVAARHMPVDRVLTPRGPRIQISLNGQIFHIAELIVKEAGTLKVLTTDGPRIYVRPFTKQ